MTGRFPELLGRGYICSHTLIQRKYIETCVSFGVAFRNSILHVYTGELGRKSWQCGRKGNCISTEQKNQPEGGGDYRIIQKCGGSSAEVANTGSRLPTNSVSTITRFSEICFQVSSKDFSKNLGLNILYILSWNILCK
jgi:hypothetical protein